MFRFVKILDITTKKHYYVQRATLIDEPFDEHPDAANIFEVDLVDEDGKYLREVAMVIGNDGGVCLPNNLGVGDDLDTVDGIIEGKTLIIATRPAEDDDDDKPGFCVSWDDHEGNEHERWFRTPQDAIHEATYLNKKYSAVAVIGPDGDQLY